MGLFQRLIYFRQNSGSIFCNLKDKICFKRRFDQIIQIFRTSDIAQMIQNAKDKDRLNVPQCFIRI